MQAGRLLNLLILATFAILETCGRTTQSPCDISNGQCSDRCVPHPNYQIPYDNLPSGYYCTCPRGKTTFRGTLCLPRNHPCFDYRFCRSNEKCVPTGSRDGYGYKCDCEEGYIPRENGRGCRQVDPCENNGGCSDVCIANWPNRTCSCRNGYKLGSDQKTCTDVDECWEGTARCEQECINVAGSYRCACKPGYSLKQGTRCEDMDECRRGFHKCSHSCQNTVGGYQCSCPAGMKLAADQRTCESDVTCATLGCSFRCQQNDPASPARCICQRGFRLNADGRTCMDIDECLETNHGCSERCVNTPGDYRCECGSGKYLSNDLKTCIVSTTPMCPRPRLHQGSFPDCGSGVSVFVPRTTCERQCNNGFELRGKKRITCQDDGTWSNYYGQCKDINECETNNGGCEQNCFNFRGGHSCGCDSGFKLRNDAKTCKDAMPPKFETCPQNIDKNTDPGRPNATVTWEAPASSDNVEVTRLNGPPNTVDLPVGFHSIVYTATDGEGNKATCAFTVHVKDQEPPSFTNCPNPISVNVQEGILVKHLTWDLPVFSDNSGQVDVVDNVPVNNDFPFGETTVRYVGKDATGNTATCEFLVNVTRTECEPLEKPQNGTHDCDTWRLGKFCHVSCDDGFGFVDPPPDEYVCGPQGTWVPNNNVPDCYPVAPPLATDLTFTATYKAACPTENQRRDIIGMLMDSQMSNLQTLCWHNGSESCDYGPASITCDGSGSEFNVSFKSLEDLTTHPALNKYMRDLMTSLQKNSRYPFFFAAYVPSVGVLGPKVNRQNLALIPELQLTCAVGQVARNHQCVICGDQPCDDFLPPVTSQ